MDKYGELYGHKKISELLGLDQSASDFSSGRKGRKWLKRDSGIGALWVHDVSKNPIKATSLDVGSLTLEVQLFTHLSLQMD